MITHFKIPTSAIHINFISDRGKKGEYYVWPSPSGNNWVWSALGNTGEEHTQDEARQSAREYIRDGTKALQRVRKTRGDS